MLEVLWLCVSALALVVFVSARGDACVLELSPVPLPLDRPQETQVLQVSFGSAHCRPDKTVKDVNWPVQDWWMVGGPLSCPRAWSGPFDWPTSDCEAVGISRANQEHGSRDYVGQTWLTLFCSLLSVVLGKSEVYVNMTVHTRQPHQRLPLLWSHWAGLRV